MLPKGASVGLVEAEVETRGGGGITSKEEEEEEGTLKSSRTMNLRRGVNVVNACKPPYYLLFLIIFRPFPLSVPTFCYLFPSFFPLFSLVAAVLIWDAASDAVPLYTYDPTCTAPPQAAFLIVPLRHLRLPYVDALVLQILIPVATVPRFLV